MPRPANEVSALNLSEIKLRRNRKPESDGSRKPARRLRLYARTEPTEQNWQVRSVCAPDLRTRIGRIATAFRRDLLEHMGGEEGMDFITRELIEQCVEMKITCCEIRAKRAAGRGSDYDAKRYGSAFNSLQRALVRLGYKEKAAVQRIRAEAEYQRSLK
jgi:hypothetical protein